MNETPSDYYAKESTERTACDCCGKFLTYYEELEPCEVKQEIEWRLGHFVTVKRKVCDLCGSDLAPFNKEAYYKAYDSIYDQFGNHNLTI